MPGVALCTRAHLKTLDSAGLQPLLRPRKVLATLHTNSGCAVRILCFPAGLLAGVKLRFIVFLGSPAGESSAGTPIIADLQWKVKFSGKLVSKDGHGMVVRRCEAYCRLASWLSSFCKAADSLLILSSMACMAIVHE